MGLPEVKSTSGKVFRWVNMANRRRNGWGIWSPVERGSELGKKISEQVDGAMQATHIEGGESNFFMASSDTVLACANKGDHAKQRAALHDAANEQLRKTASDESVRLRHTYLSVDPNRRGMGKES